MKNKNVLNVNLFDPIKTISEDIIIYENNKVASLIKINSINLSLYEVEEQLSLILRWSKALSSLEESCSIIKLEQPVNLFKYEDNEDYNKKIHIKKNLDGSLDKEKLKYRLKQINFEKEKIQYYIRENQIKQNVFYFLIYERNIDELYFAKNKILGTLQELKLDPKLCYKDEIEEVIQNIYDPNLEYKEKEGYLPDLLEFKTNRIKTNEGYQIIHGIHDYPLNIGVSWLAGLMNIPNTSVSVNIKDVSIGQAKTLMDKAIVEVRTQILSRSKASEDMAKQTQLETFLHILQEIERGNEKIKLVNIIIQGYSKNAKDLKNISRNIASAIKQVQMKADKLFCRQMEGYIAMLPTPRDDIINDNGRDMPAQTLAAGFPFIFQGLEDRDGCLLGYNFSNLIFFDPRIKNSTRVNSNIMIIGRSGSGKSYLTKKLVLRMLLQGIKVCIIDPEGEYNDLVNNLGGRSIDVGSGVTSRINPFHIFGTLEEDDDFSEKNLKTIQEKKEEKTQLLESIFLQHIQFLEQFFKSLIPSLTDKEIARLSELILECYKAKGIGFNKDFEEIPADKYPLMQDLYEIIDEKIKKLEKLIGGESNKFSSFADELADLRNLKVYVSRLSKTGALAGLWNGPTTIDVENNDLILFDFRKIRNGQNELVMNTQNLLVLKFLENEVIKNRERNLARNENNFIAIAVDEAHLLIDENSPAALYFMFQMIKRIRKYNGIFIVITQNVNDFIGGEKIKKYSTAIINGCQYSFIFGLNANDLQTLIDLYKSSGGFSKEETSFISNASVGQCLFIVSPSQRIILERVLVDKNEASSFYKEKKQ